MNYLNETYNLNGKVAIITGATGISGSAHVSALAQCGVHVVITDVSEKAEQMELLKQEVEALSGVSCFTITCDVSKKDEVENMVASAHEKFGKIDILVNNAGISGKFSDNKVAPRFEDYPQEAWDRAWDVNMTGMFLCAQAVGKVMVDACQGTMVNIASIHGLVSPDHRVYNSDGSTKIVKPISYSTTKSAVYNFTRYLAVYWGDKHIRVNTLTPGGVFDHQDPYFVQQYEYRTPMGRMANPDDLVGPLLFLVSDASKYVTGINLTVDGGLTSW